MKLIKRSFSVVLILCLVLSFFSGMAPFAAQATQPEADVNSDALTMESTNSFGSLLTEDIMAQNDDQGSDTNGYNVIGLTVENGIATVEYCALEEAIVVVSLYTEDGLQLLISGKAVVQPENTEVTIRLEGQIPQYFMASAYLLDTYDYSPLCTAYDTPMYTKAMQDLLDSTIYDYDADKVLNLDSSTDTNFAVYTDETKILDYQEGVNTVVSADDDNATYIIENADSHITGLQTGDILAYTYGENQILIVKVASLSMDGTTATISGSKVEMEEVFSYVKIETTGGTEDLSVHENTGDDGVTYLGLIKDNDEANPHTNTKGQFDIEASLGFELNKDFGNMELSGSLMLNTTVHFDYYITLRYQFIKFKTEFEIQLSAEFTAKGNIPVLKLPKFDICPIPGVFIGFEPKLQFTITGKVALTLKVNTTIGFSYEKGKKTKNLCTSPKVVFTPDLTGTVFFGLDMAPTISIMSGVIAKASLSAMTGIELKASLESQDISITGPSNDQESVHSCEKCLSIELYWKTEVKLDLQFLYFIKSNWKLSDKRLPIGISYYSFDHSKFGWGSCPYKDYRITIQVIDSQGNKISGTNVYAKAKESKDVRFLGTTNENGVITDYLIPGNYILTATVNDTILNYETAIGCACKIVLQEDGEHDLFVSNGIDHDSLLDGGPIIASGECGDKGSNVKWALYKSGILKIYGNGNMQDYDEFSQAPWKDYDGTHIAISRMIISYGVKRVGDYAFPDSCFLENLSIANSVTSIGKYAFANTNLRTVTIPDSVKSIDDCAFSMCNYLDDIIVSPYNPYFCTDDGGTLYNKDKTILIQTTNDSFPSNGYTIPNTVTTIGAGAFAGRGFERISIPDSVTVIKDHAFSEGVSIESIRIPSKVISIGDYAFSGCIFEDPVIPDTTTYIGNYAFAGSDLSTIFIGSNVKKIGSGAFFNCKNLTKISVSPDNPNYCNDEYGVLYDKNMTVIIRVPCSPLKYENFESIPYTIPHSVTNIEKYAFNQVNLESITIPDSIISIGDYAFYNSNVQNVFLPNSVSSIGDYAFYKNTYLENITIPNSITSIGDYAFYECIYLNDITIPDSVITIGDYAFYGLGFHAQSVTIGNNVTEIGDYAFSKSEIDKLIIGNSVILIGAGAFDGCHYLTSVTIPDSVKSIGNSAFRDCHELTYVKIGNGVSSINDGAFYNCYNLKDVVIGRNVSVIGLDAFYLCYNITDIYYNNNESQWNIMQIDEGSKEYLSYANIHYNSTGSEIQNREINNSFPQSTTMVQNNHLIATSIKDYRGIYHGEYGTEELDNYTLKTAFFTDLVPGEHYVLLALVNTKCEDPLSADNLLYIRQDTAAEDGTLSFSYVQRVPTEISYVMVCGASNQNLQDAEILFPEMIASKESQVVNPTVTYNGKILNEGTDYVITGSVDYTKEGQYTCYIRGIRNYTGLVTCQYQVSHNPDLYVTGDLTGDKLVDNRDVEYLLWHTLFPTEYTLNQDADLNQDGNVDNRDVEYLLWHTLFPADYPLIIQ